MEATKKSPYFVGPIVDTMSVGLFSIIFYFIIEALSSKLGPTTITTWAVTLSWIINWPHFSMSSYRLYSSKDNIKQYPVTSYLIPFIVLAFGFLAFYSPLIMAPFLLKVYLIWSPYHFCAQSMGISMVYAHRTGYRINATERFLFSSFIFSAYFHSMSIIDIDRARQSVIMGIPYPGFGAPDWARTVTKYWMYLSAIALIIAIGRKYFIKKEKIHPIVLVPAITQFFWFGYSMGNNHYYELVPAFHSFQYMFIAWMVHLAQSRDKGTVKTNSMKWYGFNFLGGVLLFYLIPKGLEKFGFTYGMATGVTLIVVQLHHFFVDGVIWKLRNNSNVNPLAVTLKELN